MAKLDEELEEAKKNGHLVEAVNDFDSKECDGENLGRVDAGTYSGLETSQGRRAWRTTKGQS